MTTSGPVRKTHEDPKISFSDFLGKLNTDYEVIKSLAPNILKVSFNGKLWLLKKAKTDGSIERQLLYREYEIGRSLQHPFIVSVVGLTERSPEGPAIIMEYVEGRTLADFITSNPGSSDRKKILGELLDAVDYLHSKGLLHNDIKADNILVSNIGNHVKLIDFGLSESVADPLFRRLGGTDGSSAPEVIGGRTDIPSDASSDIWSLGVIISEVFPKKYSQIVRKCMKKNPSSRFRDVNSLRKAINRCDRWPLFASAAALAMLLFAAAAIPDLQNFREDRQAQIAAENEKGQIEKDIQELWAPTADSLNNRELVGYNEFAQLIFGDFADKFGKYRQNYAGPGNETYLSILDYIYQQHWNEYLSICESLPSFSKLKCTGELSAKEAAWYYYLFAIGKRYIPYTGQTPPKPWWDPAWDAAYNK